MISSSDEMLLDRDSGNLAPARPYPTPLLAFGGAMWPSCAAVLLALRPLDVFACFCLLLASSVLLLACTIQAVKRSHLVRWCVAGGIIAGCACAAAGALYLKSVNATFDEQVFKSVIVECAEDGREGPFSAECFVWAEVQDGSRVRAVLHVSGETPSLRYGERFFVDGSISRAEYAARERLWREGVVAVIDALSLEPVARDDVLAGLLAVRSRAIDVFEGHPSEEAAVLQALSTGSREQLTGGGLYSDFKTCGLAHMVAVSGAHLVIVTGLFAHALVSMRCPAPVRIVILSVFMLVYLVLAAAPVSALRAALMALAASSSFFARRRPSSANAVGLCLILFTMFSPPATLSVSFALSALSTAGVVIFAPLVSHWIAHLVPRIPRFVSEALSLTLAANLASLPLSCSLFSQMPLIAPAANVVCAPLFPFVCATGLVVGLLGAFSPQAAILVLFAAQVPAGILCTLVHLLAAVPFASVPVSLDAPIALVIGLGACSLLWFYWPRPSRCVAAAALGVVTGALAIALVVAPRAVPDRIVMLDVGQGDALLVQSEGVSLLVDTGNHDTQLLSALGRQGVARLDAVIVTHADSDHCGALDALERAVDVGEVLVARDMLSCEDDSCRALIAQASRTAGSVEGLDAGDVVRFGTFEAHVTWPHAFAADGGNADSVCFFLSCDVDADGAGDYRALFTGDAEIPQLESFLDLEGGDAVDVLKVCHHGSRNGLDEHIARTLHPRIALISVGARNTYGHPAPEVLRLLDGVGAEVFRTDEDGDVSCEFTRAGIDVTTQR